MNNNDYEMQEMHKKVYNQLMEDLKDEKFCEKLVFGIVVDYNEGY